MKKKVIKSITLIAIGALLVGVPVGAATYISSRDIEYTTEHNENITNVNEALDDLISNVNEIKTSGTATSSEILSGKTAYVKGNLVTGTRTAQNNSYELIYNSNVTAFGTTKDRAFTYAAPQNGKVIINITGIDSTGALNSNFKYSITKNSVAISQTDGHVGQWNGYLYYLIDVEKGDTIFASAKLSSSQQLGVSLFGVFVR